MITLTFRFYVEVDMPAGPGAELREVSREFDTDDVDHAYELAERALSNPFDPILPARVIAGTLTIV